MDSLSRQDPLGVRIKDFLSQFTLVEVMIVVVILGLLAAMAIPMVDYIWRYDQREHERYTLFCKVYARTDLTFEEFEAADRAGMIPHNGH